MCTLRHGGNRTAHTTGTLFFWFTTPTQQDAYRNWCPLNQYFLHFHKAINNYIKHLNRHHLARTSGCLCLTTLWCTVPPLHVHCTFLYIHIHVPAAVTDSISLGGSFTCTGLPIISCTVTRGNSGRRGIRDGARYLSSAL